MSFTHAQRHEHWQLVGDPSPLRKLLVPLERSGVRVFVRLANAVYAILKALPVRNKVVFITWNSDEVTQDFQSLINRLKALPRAPSVVALCRELSGGLASHIAYGLHMFRQMYHMATAKVVVLDAYCVMASILDHRPELRVVQLWHALGAFKKFGWSIVDKSEGWSAQSNIPSRTLSHLLRMHHGYTDAVVSYSGAIPYFAEAFDCDPSIIKVAWLPRVDYLRDDAYSTKMRRRILDAHPELEGKPIVLYAPTIRRTAMDSSRILSLVSSIDAADWNLVIKRHPIRGESLEPVFPTLSFDIPDFTAMQLLAVADAVITDYSAIVYEAYLRGVPVYFFAHDITEYEQVRGFYTHPSQFPSKTYDTVGDLIRDLNARVGDREAMRAFAATVIEDSEARVDIFDLINPATAWHRR